MPVCLMFHSVGLRRHAWAAPQIAEDIAPFRSKIRAIRRAGYRIVPFSDDRLHDPRCREKLACLTFDDGYLDNWVHVEPILRELEAPATIFVSSEFVDPRDVVRPQAGEVPDDRHVAADCCAGFLSWPELRRLQSGGLVEIGSHAATHTQWPDQPEIVDFWTPGAALRPGGPVHELWNLDPDRKPFYLTEAAQDESKLAYGSPVYHHERALVARRFFADDQDLREKLTGIVREEGVSSFFADTPRALRRLRDVADRWASSRGGRVPGRFEDDDERVDRVRQELEGSRRQLSTRLGFEVRSVCWPQGGIDEQALEIARSAGYRRFTLPSAWLPDHRRGAYSDLLPRISSVPRESRGNLDLGNLTSTEFVWYLKRNEGSHLHKLLYRGAKLARIARAGIRAFD